MTSQIVNIPYIFRLVYKLCRLEIIPFLPIPSNMDCVCDQHRRQMLQKYNMILAIEVVELLKDTVYEQCYGCSVDHPSQTQHSCIMETSLTHLEMYFEMTLEKVDRVSVIDKWRKEIALLDLPFESVKVFNELLISQELKEKHLTDSWKEELYKLCEKIMKLETRLSGL